MNTAGTGSQTMYTELVRRWKAGYRANGHTFLGTRAHRSLYRHILARHVPEALRTRPVTVLDSACGNGYLAPLIRQYLPVRRFDGIDLNRDALSVASSTFGYTAAIQGNVLELEGSVKDTYDIVNNCDMFFHIAPSDRLRFWRSHCGRIAPGGRMICIVPNLTSLYRRVRPLRIGHFFSIQDILNNLAQLPDFKIASFTGVTLIRAAILCFPPDTTSLTNMSRAFAVGITIKRSTEP